MAVRVAIREALADRMVSTHIPRSSSLAVVDFQSVSIRRRRDKHSHAYKAKEK
jgi:predicted Fe-Mo cluster-binding NifX family protein